MTAWAAGPELSPGDRQTRLHFGARSVLLLLVLAIRCGGGPPAPAALDTRNDACAWCRMAVSQPRFAAQLVAPGEEPRFFDDIGCLADFLRSSQSLPPASVAYVADHRSGAWVDAVAAVYVRCPALATPMASGLAAFADAGSRAADAEVRGCAELGVIDLLPALPAGGA
jgi:copper chaperone NosL